MWLPISGGTTFGFSCRLRIALVPLTAAFSSARKLYVITAETLQVWPARRNPPLLTGSTHWIYSLDQNRRQVSSRTGSVTVAAFTQNRFTWSFGAYKRFVNFRKVLSRWVTRSYGVHLVSNTLNRPSLIASTSSRGPLINSESELLINFGLLLNAIWRPTLRSSNFSSGSPLNAVAARRRRKSLVRLIWINLLSFFLINFN